MGKSPFVGIGCPGRAERSWINQTLPHAPPTGRGVYTSSAENATERVTTPLPG